METHRCEVPVQGRCVLSSVKGQRPERAWGLAQWHNCLPGRCEFVSSIPSKTWEKIRAQHRDRCRLLWPAWPVASGVQVCRLSWWPVPTWPSCGQF